VKIAIASDHAGFELKSAVAKALEDAGHELVDYGTDSDASVDYPDFAEPAARAVAAGEAERGVLVCGSGVGVAIVANKVDGVRAVHAHDVAEAEMSRRHNDANVVTLGERTEAPAAAIEIVNHFLSTDFEGGRHQRRVEKIDGVEEHTRELAEAKETNR
jgi:ribose 5-phosphate isomerase B